MTDIERDDRMGPERVPFVGATGPDPEHYEKQRLEIEALRADPQELWLRLEALTMKHARTLAFLFRSFEFMPPELQAEVLAHLQKKS
jgi:hypothetical protein